MSREPGASRGFWKREVVPESAHPVKKMGTSKDKTEIGLLSQRFFSGEITPEEADRLWDRLQSDPEAIRPMVEQCEMDFRLNLFFDLKRRKQLEREDRSDRRDRPPGEELPSLLEIFSRLEKPVASPASSRIPRGPMRRWYPVWSLPVLGLVALIVFGLGFLFLGDGKGRPIFFPGPKEPSFARVTAASGIVWPEGTAPIKAGSRLETKQIRFEKGTMELQFASGLRLALEGPADFYLNVNRPSFLHRGRLSVFVPPRERGYAVATPWLTLVDQGTEFTLDVTDKGAEASTVTGKTVLTQLAEPDIVLLQGNGVRVDGNRKCEEMFLADPGAFLSRQAVADLVADESTRALLAWKNVLFRWNKDPGLLVHFDFENASKTVPNVAVSGRTVVGDGKVSGTRRTEGRWKGKHALEFASPDDFVTVRVPRHLESLTLIAHIRMDRFDYFSRCLLACTETGSGSLEWQIGNGSLRLALGSMEDEERIDYPSPIVFSRENVGPWYQVATVLDGSAGTITHYLDGRSIGCSTLREPCRVRIGEAMLGNGPWKPEVPLNRSFRGEFDEFLLFDRALSAEEISNLFME